MYIMDVGKDLNKKTGTFVANDDGYCVIAYSFAPHTVRTIQFYVVVLNQITICAFAHTNFFVGLDVRDLLGLW